METNMNVDFQPSLICQKYAEYAATAIIDSDFLPGLAQERAQFDEIIQTPLQVLIEPISARKISNGGQPRKGSKTRNETPNSFDVSKTKPRLKVKISKSSKGTFLSENTDVFVITSNRRTFFFTETENLNFGD